MRDQSELFQSIVRTLVHAEGEAWMEELEAQAVNTHKQTRDSHELYNIARTHRRRRHQIFRTVTDDAGKEQEDEER